jgi:hypothetical protein
VAKAKTGERQGTAGENALEGSKRRNNHLKGVAGARAKQGRDRVQLEKTRLRGPKGETITGEQGSGKSENGGEAGRSRGKRGEEAKKEQQSRLGAKATQGRGATKTSSCT